MQLQHRLILKESDSLVLKDINGITFSEISQAQMGKFYVILLI